MLELLQGMVASLLKIITYWCDTKEVYCYKPDFFFSSTEYFCKD